jgi:YfdX protein
MTENGATWDGWPVMKRKMNHTEMKSFPKRDGEKRLASLFLVTGLATLAGLVGTARGADPITSTVDVTPPTQQLTGDEWRSISLSAGRVLRHVDQALDALAEQKKDVASANIGKGLMLIKIVDDTLPPTLVKTEVKGDGLTYQDEDSIKPAFVPIYREYDNVDVVSSVTAEKQLAGAAQPASPATRSADAPEYTYAGFDYTGIKLNLRLAKRDLLLAQKLVEQGDTKGAAAALHYIQAAGVIFEFSSEREPLVRAMDNLRLAETELKANRPDQAKTALTGAEDALRNYGKLAGESRSKEVTELNKDVAEVARNIANEKEESFSKKISSWWDKCELWFRS